METLKALFLMIILFVLCRTMFWVVIAVAVLFWLYLRYTDKQISSQQSEDGAQDEFQQKLDSGEIRTEDDVIYHNGKYYENENSEEWEDFEYQYEEDHRRR